MTCNCNKDKNVHRYVEEGKEEREIIWKLRYLLGIRPLHIQGLRR